MKGSHHYFWVQLNVTIVTLSLSTSCQIHFWSSMCGFFMFYLFLKNALSCLIWRDWRSAMTFIKTICYLNLCGSSDASAVLAGLASFQQFLQKPHSCRNHSTRTELTFLWSYCEIQKWETQNTRTLEDAEKDTGVILCLCTSGLQQVNRQNEVTWGADSFREVNRVRRLNLTSR